ncbi:transposable element Tcb2 transposase [Trichonephila clavipes]|nr:transposable element Tcb2 transposase [Trichonephila clavipes]
MRGTLTGQRYIDDIFRPHVGPFLNGLPGGIFQQDNAQHAWDQLKRQMPSCQPVHDLELAAQDLWAHLPEDNIRCLINSMSDRVATCIAAGVEKFNLAAVLLREGDWKMSRQWDLPESMAWCIIGRLESEQTQKNIADAVGATISVIVRQYNRFKRNRACSTLARTRSSTRLPWQIMTDISNKQLFETEQPISMRFQRQFLLTAG